MLLKGKNPVIRIVCGCQWYSCGAGVMDALVRVAWPLSAEYAEDSRYNTLLQISIGQEEVDEIITRDINRTFPEHPQFGFQQGQQALFRVLKAYSLHDLEVSSTHWVQSNVTESIVSSQP